MKMKKLVLIAIFGLFSAPIQASLLRTDFIGTVTNGGFTGALIADWTTGMVSAFYADIAYNDGTTERFSILNNHDMVEVVQNNVSTQYWSDGHTNQYTGSFSFDFAVSRFERDQNGNLSVGPSPDWAMYLDLSGSRWIFTDNKTITVPCSSPSGYCWEETSSFLISGRLTSSTTSPVPLPSS